MASLHLLRVCCFPAIDLPLKVLNERLQLLTAYDTDGTALHACLWGEVVGKWRRNDESLRQPIVSVGLL